MVCRNCGHENPGNAQFCSLCNARLRDPMGAPPARPPSVGAERRAQVARELERKARQRRLVEAIATPVLALVAVGLIVLTVQSFRAGRARIPLVTDSTFVGAATLYFRANETGDWRAMWDCLATPVKRRVSYEEFRRHVGKGYLRQITEPDWVDYSYFDEEETKAYMAVETSLGRQTLFLVREGEHWKVAWSFPVRDIAKLDIPF